MQALRCMLPMTLLALVALSVTGLVGVAAAEERSNVGAVFHIGAGARPLAMGGAFVGLADDENALFYNPAGLTELERPGVTSLYSTQYGVISYGALGLAARNFGGAALYLDSSGIPSAGPGSEIGPEFSYSNLAILGGGAYRFGPVSLGLRGKYLSVRSAEPMQPDQPTTLKGASGSGFAVDLAALANVGPVRVGAMLENALSSPVRYSTGASEPWERKLRAGASASLGRVILAADLENLGAPPVYYHAGAEVAIGIVALRAGATGPLGAGGDRDLTAGAGVLLGNVQVDYAFLMPQTLPQSHRLSLTVCF